MTDVNKVSMDHIVTARATTGARRTCVHRAWASAQVGVLLAILVLTVIWSVRTAWGVCVTRSMGIVTDYALTVSMEQRATPGVATRAWGLFVTRTMPRASRLA